MGDTTMRFGSVTLRILMGRIDAFRDPDPIGERSDSDRMPSRLPTIAVIFERMLGMAGAEFHQPGLGPKPLSARRNKSAVSAVPGSDEA